MRYGAQLEKNGIFAIPIGYLRQKARVINMECSKEHNCRLPEVKTLEMPHEKWKYAILSHCVKASIGFWA